MVRDAYSDLLGRGHCAVLLRALDGAEGELEAGVRKTLR